MPQPTPRCTAAMPMARKWAGIRVAASTWAAVAQPPTGSKTREACRAETKLIRLSSMRARAARSSTPISSHQALQVACIWGPRRRSVTNSTSNSTSSSRSRTRRQTLRSRQIQVQSMATTSLYLWQRRPRIIPLPLSRIRAFRWATRLRQTTANWRCTRSTPVSTKTSARSRTALSSSITTTTAPIEPLCSRVATCQPLRTLSHKETTKKHCLDWLRSEKIFLIEIVFLFRLKKISTIY